MYSIKLSATDIFQFITDDTVVLRIIYYIHGHVYCPNQVNISKYFMVTISRHSVCKQIFLSGHLNLHVRRCKYFMRGNITFQSGSYFSYCQNTIYPLTQNELRWRNQMRPRCHLGLMSSLLHTKPPYSICHLIQLKVCTYSRNILLLSYIISLIDA